MHLYIYITPFLKTGEPNFDAEISAPNSRRENAQKSRQRCDTCPFYLHISADVIHCRYSLSKPTGEREN